MPGSQFKCRFKGCKSRSFTRRGDLIRHARKHDSSKLFSCPAENCNRTRSKGFTRKDKLIDHLLAGHDDDTLLACPECQIVLTRDVMAVHLRSDAVFGTLNGYRTCPMPSCSYKIHTTYYTHHNAALELKSHLLEKHDSKERFRCIDLLGRRGYEYQSCDAICPICLSPCQFPNQREFCEHFMQTHFHGSACEYHTDEPCSTTCYFRDYWHRLERSKSIWEEFRQHRCVILRIWLAFADHSVWNDILCCKSKEFQTR
ncbi:hypothetical protein GQ44DRAFT_330941 [Phaeosphaeriaceae sp. PMI808]|nr:hypothetical protein GQ44DRAFT_330941 [Phaeosphaeriaceae sp. PMI808]